MKLNSSALIALLCGSLLLSLSPASAQRHDSRKSKTKNKTTSVQTPKSETPTLGRPSLAGRYILDDSGAAERVKGAIEEAVKDLTFATKGKARSGLIETNLPPPNSITISFTDGEVIIETDIAGKVRTSINGKQSSWSKGKDTYKVSTIGDQGHLERTYIGRGAKRVNVYSLGDGGNTLTMQVIVERKNWVGGFKLAYNLVYRRAA